MTGGWWKSTPMRINYVRKLKMRRRADAKKPMEAKMHLI